MNSCPELGICRLEVVNMVITASRYLTQAALITS